ncbi:WGR domain-containing protein [Sphingomonas floccifaciens]|uniref:WGR domain-containing protein n=1 Tax=Sphingomonas floccifaciens TaxID=1844115 RepID=A0ABW4NGI9_9SPHN
MDTLPPAPIELVAVDRTRNIHRRWSLVAGRDLFGRVVVETDWGRIGRRGQQLVKSFADEAAALRHIRMLLARRRSAERRLGVGYVAREDMDVRAC